MDQHLISEGRHEELWTVLGSHVRRYDTPRGEVVGTSFAVSAPNASGVHVTGDFDFWDGRAHPMRSLGSTGIWELFLPNVGKGAMYKYEVLGADGVWRDKADPMATHTQVPPERAWSSGVGDHLGDPEWMTARANRPAESPMSVYEVHLGSWRKDRSYAQLADELVDYVSDLGFTHVELLPCRRASVRRFVGLSGHVLLRADRAVRRS